MVLVPLFPTFHRLNREHFQGMLARGSDSLVSIRWSDGRLTNTAGFYQRGPRVKSNKGCEIVLSKPVLAHLPQTAITSTLCHEMIHAWVDLVLGIRETHGKNFRAYMKMINNSQNEFQVTIRHQFPTSSRPPKWVASCDSCGKKSFYKRLVKGAACKYCCDNLYGGRWDPRCLLNYELNNV